MAFIDNFAEMMPHTVTIRGAVTSRNRYGEATHSTGTSYQARVVSKPQEIRDNDGEMYFIRSMVWLKSTGTFTPATKIVLPDNSTSYIMSVETYPDEDGHAYTKLLCGDQPVDMRARRRISG